MQLQKVSGGFAIFIAVLALSAGVANAGARANPEVVLAQDLEWGYLNPARGAQGPAAADLWGDRTRDTASGILLEFPAGFESPSHIHNITYRGVVIQGRLHNDDPGAQPMWMPAGSFWVQPAGEAHITAANGSKNIAYIEIDSGPYLVQPTAQAFDSGLRPINVDASNTVWLQASEVASVSAAGVAIAYLWGDHAAGSTSGAMLRVPADFNGVITSAAESFKAVVIQGELTYASKKNAKSLGPGSYFGSAGEFDHQFGTASAGEVLLYIRSNGPFEITAR